MGACHPDDQPCEHEHDNGANSGREMGIDVFNADFRQHRCQRRKHRRQQSIHDPHIDPFAFVENFSHLLYYEKEEHFAIFPFVCYNGGQAPLLRAGR